MSNILVFIIKALTIYGCFYGIADRICNCIEKCKKGDDYGKSIAKGFKDSINKDFNERFAK